MNFKDKETMKNNIERLIQDREAKLAIKMKEVKEIEDEIERLNDIYKNTIKSELELVLYKINTTHPMPEDENEMENTFIIYNPELEKVYEIVRKGKERNSIPKDMIDLTHYLFKSAIPQNMWPEKPLQDDNINNTIKNDIIQIKCFIERIKEIKKCESWEEIRENMKNVLSSYNYNLFNDNNNKTLK